jgi:hypothetical protein
MRQSLLTSFLLLALAVSPARVEALAPETLEGKILDPSRPLATLLVGQEKVVLHLGPLWFWEGNDLYIEAEEELVAIGELEVVDGVKHFYPNRLVLEDREIKLASEDGIPLWARGGPRGPDRSGGRGREAGGGRGRRGGGHRGHNGGGNSWRN